MGPAEVEMLVTYPIETAMMGLPRMLEVRSVSKLGLSMWAKALAVRLAPEGIPVFEIRPGVIRTDMTAKVAAKYDARIAEGLIPAGRWGEGEDVAAAVAALTSGQFAYATGTVINVDGGLLIPRL